jgi:hypothetical protein
VKFKALTHLRQRGYGERVKKIIFPDIRSSERRRNEYTLVKKIVFISQKFLNELKSLFLYFPRNEYEVGESIGRSFFFIHHDNYRTNVLILQGSCERKIEGKTLDGCPPGVVKSARL